MCIEAAESLSQAPTSGYTLQPDHIVNQHHHWRQHLIPPWSEPILVVSSHEDPRYAAKAIADGASGYLVKANALSEMKAATETVLSGRIYVGADLVDYLTSSLVGESLSKNPIEQLSQQELLVMNHIADGRGLSEIAEKMKVSTKTIETYRVRVFKKLGLKSNNELVKFVLENNRKAD